MERSSDRVARVVTIFAWIPAMAFLIPYGIKSHSACPSLGLIPMTVSSLAGVIHVTGYAKLRWANILVDLITASCLIAVLLPSWITMAKGSNWRVRGSPETIMLGTYGTMPMMVNFAIHAWFVLSEIYVDWMGFGEKTCPHCHCDIGPSHRATRGGYKRAPTDYEDAPESSHDSKDTCHATHLNQQKAEPSASKDPRPSSDDENARLV